MPVRTNQLPPRTLKRSEIAEIVAGVKIVIMHDALEFALDSFKGLLREFETAILPLVRHDHALFTVSQLDTKQSKTISKWGQLNRNAWTETFRISDCPYYKSSDVIDWKLFPHLVTPEAGNQQPFDMEGNFRDTIYSMLAYGTDHKPLLKTILVCSTRGSLARVFRNQRELNKRFEPNTIVLHHGLHADEARYLHRSFLECSKSILLVTVDMLCGLDFEVDQILFVEHPPSHRCAIENEIINIATTNRMGIRGELHVLFECSRTGLEAFFSMYDRVNLKGYDSIRWHSQINMARGRIDNLFEEFGGPPNLDLGSGFRRLKSHTC